MSAVLAARGAQVVRPSGRSVQGEEELLAAKRAKDELERRMQEQAGERLKRQHVRVTALVLPGVAWHAGKARGTWHSGTPLLCDAFLFYRPGSWRSCKQPPHTSSSSCSSCRRS